MNFYDHIGNYGSRTAVITSASEHISYEKSLFDADLVAGHMDTRSLVFSVCTNSYESVVGYVGFLRKRIVPALIGGNTNSELFMQLVEAYKPSYIWVPSLGEKASLFKECDLIFELGDYALFKTRHITDYVLHDDLALLLTTSGSTGSAKFVRLSYRNIVSNANAVAQCLEISQDDRPITTMPMSYTYGLSIINSHLLKGASIIMTDRSMMEKEFWTLLREEKATTFGGVPYTYEILKRLRFSRMSIPSLRVLNQAGGKLSEELSVEFSKICAEKGMKFIAMYGQTEATARMSFRPWEYALAKPGSIGMAIPGGEFSLIDECGETIVGSGAVGELVYRGDNVSMGYAEGCEDLHRGDENAGRLATGDLAMRDDDGFYYIMGRKKRFLKVFGNRVSLDELEGILRRLGHDCACAGEDDHLTVFVAASTDSQAVKKDMLEHTSINPNGFHIRIIDKIPRNEAGKILYANLVGKEEVNQ